MLTDSTLKCKNRTFLWLKSNKFHSKRSQNMLQINMSRISTRCLRLIDRFCPRSLSISTRNSNFALTLTLKCVSSPAWEWTHRWKCVGRQSLPQRGTSGLTYNLVMIHLYLQMKTQFSATQKPKLPRSSSMTRNLPREKAQVKISTLEPQANKMRF